jgi:hypothetical protein
MAIDNQAARPENASHPPSGRSPIVTTVLGCLGLLLGLGAAFLIDHLDDSVRNADDLARLGPDVALLASIPNLTTKDTRPVAISAPDTPPVESYRNLRTNVQFLGIERKLRLIQVTSTRPGEGKTTFSCSLGALLTKMNASRRVLIVDLDLRAGLDAEPVPIFIQQLQKDIWFWEDKQIVDIFIKSPRLGRDGAGSEVPSCRYGGVMLHLPSPIGALLF